MRRWIIAIVACLIFVVPGSVSASGKDHRKHFLYTYYNVVYGAAHHSNYSACGNDCQSVVWRRTGSGQTFVDTIAASMANFSVCRYDWDASTTPAMIYRCGGIYNNFNAGGRGQSNSQIAVWIRKPGFHAGCYYFSPVHYMNIPDNYAGPVNASYLYLSGQESC